MEQKYYFLSKQAYEGDFIKIDYHNINGFHFSPQNQEKYEGIAVDRVIIVKPSMIEKVLKRKIKKRLDLYLQYIIHLLENGGDEDPSNLRRALNDLTRYKMMVYNQYRKYLDEKYVDLLLKKMEVLERELNTKLFYLRGPIIEPVQAEEHRRGR